MDCFLILHLSRICSLFLPFFIVAAVFFLIVFFFHFPLLYGFFGFDTDFLAAGAGELETVGVFVAAGMLVTVGVLVAGMSLASVTQNRVPLSLE